MCASPLVHLGQVHQVFLSGPADQWNPFRLSPLESRALPVVKIKRLVAVSFINIANLNFLGKSQSNLPSVQFVPQNQVLQEYPERRQ